MIYQRVIRKILVMQLLHILIDTIVAAGIKTQCTAFNHCTFSITRLLLWLLITLFGTYQLPAVQGCNINDSCLLGVK